MKNKLTLEWNISKTDKLTMESSGKVSTDLIWAFQSFINNFEGNHWEKAIKVLKDFKP